MTEPTASPPGPRRAAVIFIFVTVMLDMIAVGVIVPVLPKLIVDFAGGDTAGGALYYGLFGTAWALMQFIFAPVLGSLSDRFGRRPVILLSNFGMGIDYIFMAMAPSLSWLFLGRVISGITAASIPTASAYIADVTPPEKRAAAFGLLGAAFGVGFVFGPALGGWTGSLDPHLPFWISAGLSLANACYGFFVLPESLAREKRAAYSWKRANPVGSLALLRAQPGLLGLAAVNVIGFLAHEVLPSVFVLYGGYRYGWDARAIGFTMAIVGVCSGVVQGALVGPFVKRFGERKAVLTGLICGIGGFATIGLAPTGTLSLLGIPLLSLWGLAGPSALGLMSGRVGPSEQGQLQGANSSLRGLAGLIGPGLFTFTFATFIATGRGFELPGAPFLLSASLLVCSTLLAWRVATQSAAAPELRKPV